MSGEENEEKKSERLQMFISKREIEAIDDWGFRHRNRSRSDAIRKLVTVGIETDDRIENANKIIGGMLRKYLIASEKMIQEPGKVSHEAGNLAIKALSGIFEDLMELQLHLESVSATVQAARNDGSIDEVLSQIDQLKVATRDKFDLLKSELEKSKK